MHSVVATTERRVNARDSEAKRHSIAKFSRLHCVENGDDVMHEPQVYRDRAARARSRARETRLPELRRTFEVVATGYDALAKDAEWLGGNPPTIEAGARD